MKPQLKKEKKPKGDLTQVKKVKKVKTVKTVKTVKKAKVAKPPKAAKNDSDSEELILSGSENGDADIQNVEQISSEVSDLLAVLRKEHGIAEPVEIKAKKKRDTLDKTTPTADTSQANGKKEKKEKKKKAKQPEPIESADADDAEAVQAADKKTKKKRKLAESESAAQDESPPKKAKKSKKAAKETEPTENADAGAEADQSSAAEAVKPPIKDHHLKGATPVFVANLPLNTKYMQLKTKFQQFGDVLAIHVRTNSGRSFMRKEQLKNVPYLIAFVYFKERGDAEKCLSLNNTEYRGRVIRVDLDTDQSEKVAPKHTIVVGNLKYAVTEEILRQTFECCGELRYVRTLQCDKGCKGIAYVCFENAESVGLALKLNKTLILDREVRVERYIAKKKKKQKAPAPAQSPGKGKSGKGKKATVPGKKPHAIGKKPLATGKKPLTTGKKPLAAGKKPKDGKKKEFTGVKSTTKKTTPLKKKKKAAMSKEKKLAKKIAPKKKATKTTE